MQPAPFSTMEQNQIQDYDLTFAGVPMTEQRYSVNVYSMTKEGEFNLDNTSLKNFFNSPQIQNNEIGKVGARKMLIRGQYLGQLRTIESLGIVDNSNQISMYNGLKASANADAILPYRMRIVGHFNSEAFSGRTVEIYVNDGAGSNTLSVTYAGKWLISRVEHHWEAKDRKLNTMINLVRSGLEISNKQTPLSDIFNDF